MAFKAIYKRDAKLMNSFFSVPSQFSLIKIATSLPQCFLNCNCPIFTLPNAKHQSFTSLVVNNKIIT